MIRLSGNVYLATADIVALGLPGPGTGGPPPRAGMWALVRTPPAPQGATGSNMQGISCRSVRACIAVGGYSPRGGGPGPLALRWDGTRGPTQPTPRPSSGQLWGIACPDATACVAVGSGRRPLAEHWDGS